MHNSADFSPDRCYRYQLTRRWSRRPLVGWVLLNPSVAGAETDDPTIRRCIGFARRWGFGGIVVRNLFALRATDPAELQHHPDPVGPENDAYLACCTDDPMTVLAWGAPGRGRGDRIRHVFEERHVRLRQLAVTATGQPAHPLYLRADRLPTPLPGH